jgi:hypothetical protein
MTRNVLHHWQRVSPFGAEVSGLPFVVLSGLAWFLLGMPVI